MGEQQKRKQQKFIIHVKNPEKSYQQRKEKRIFFGITISGQKNMVAAFPAAKLGLLVIKQITKPLANSIAKRAAKSPFFRNYLCIPTFSIISMSKFECEF